MLNFTVYVNANLSSLNQMRTRYRSLHFCNVTRTFGVGCLLSQVTTSEGTLSITTVRVIRCVAPSINALWYGSMKWNMEENFSMEWNGRFLVWKENCQNGIWKNHLPFHTMLKACYKISLLLPHVPQVHQQKCPHF